jgi:hypothetical protein
MTTILGVDPGAHGAIAMVSPMVEVWDLPSIAADLADLMRTWSGSDTVRVYIEKAQSFPGMGVSGAFNYGAGYGTILGVLGALKFSVVEVSPATWKRALGLSGEATDSVKEKKARARKLARQLFPEANLSRADKAEALLIAWFGLQKEGG